MGKSLSYLGQTRDLAAPQTPTTAGYSARVHILRSLPKFEASEPVGG